MPPTEPRLTWARVQELDRAARNALLFYGDRDTTISVRADELAALTGALLSARAKRDTAPERDPAR